MTARVTSIVRQISIHIYLPDNDTENYDAFCMVSIYGDRGWMFGINGKGFYEFAEEIFARCEAHGVKVLEGYVTRAHAVLMKRTAKDRFKVDITHEGTMGAMPMVWVAIQRAGS